MTFLTPLLPSLMYLCPMSGSLITQYDNPPSLSVCDFINEWSLTRLFLLNCRCIFRKMLRGPSNAFPLEKKKHFTSSIRCSWSSTSCCYAWTNTNLWFTGIFILCTSKSAKEQSNKVWQKRCNNNNSWRRNFVEDSWCSFFENLIFLRHQSVFICFVFVFEQKWSTRWICVYL